MSEEVTETALTPQQQIQEKMVESLEAMQEYTNATGEFVAEQAPLVVQEIHTWGMIESIGLGFFWLVASLLLILGGRKLRTLIGKNWYEEELNALSDKRQASGNRLDYADESRIRVLNENNMYLSIFAQVVSIAMFVFSFLFFVWFVLPNFFTAAYIHFAPRLYLIDQLVEMTQRIF